MVHASHRSNCFATAVAWVEEAGQYLVTGHANGLLGLWRLVVEEDEEPSITLVKAIEGENAKETSVLSIEHVQCMVVDGKLQVLALQHVETDGSGQQVIGLWHIG